MAVRNREFPLICFRLDGYPRFPLFSSELSDRVRAEELSKSSKPQPQSQVKLVEVKSESFLDTGPHCTCRVGQTVFLTLIVNEDILEVALHDLVSR